MLQRFTIQITTPSGRIIKLPPMDEPHSKQVFATLTADLTKAGFKVTLVTYTGPVSK